MSNAMSTESASPDEARMLAYKAFSRAFSYPDDDFFSGFPDLSEQREFFHQEYDRLFRVCEIWLFGAEYIAQNEFQRVNLLSDIMGFYRAFGVEPEHDRPDSLTNELEFMHYLIFKEKRAAEIGQDQEKSSMCFDAQKKFFTEHVYPAAKHIAGSIVAATRNRFYKEMSEDLLDFLEQEKAVLGGTL